MAVQIQVDQPGSGVPPGIPGEAREDMATGFGATLTATGGPFIAYQWSIIDKAVDIITPALSAAALGAPSAAVTTLTPIDNVGTYLVQVVVDSGAGLGATADDVARITFYAGTVINSLNADPTLLPRRQMAFRETTEHNVPDALFPLGNSRGWAQEWERWFSLLKVLFARPSPFAHAAVTAPSGGPAVIAGQANVATVTRTSLGTYAVVFTAAAGSANYSVTCGAEVVGGMFSVGTKLTTGFVIERSDIGGALLDEDFSFQVMI